MNYTTVAKTLPVARVNYNLQKYYETLNQNYLQEIRDEIFSGELVKANRFLLAKIKARLMEYQIKDHSLAQEIMKIAHFHLFNALPNDLKKLIGVLSGPTTLGRLALTSHSNHTLQTSSNVIAVGLSSKYIVQPKRPYSYDPNDHYNQTEHSEYNRITRKNKTEFLKRLNLAGKHLTHVHFQDFEFTLEDLLYISKICPKIQKIDGLVVDFNNITPDSYRIIPQLPRPIILAIISKDHFIERKDKGKHIFLELIKQAGLDAIHLNLNALPFTSEELRLIFQLCLNIKSIKNLNLLAGFVSNQPPPFSPEFCARFILKKNDSLYKDPINKTALLEKFFQLASYAGEHAVQVNFNDLDFNAEGVTSIFQACPNIRKIRGLSLHGSILNNPSLFSLPTSLVSLNLCLYGWVDKIFHTPMLNLKFLNLKFSAYTGNDNFLIHTPNLESLTLENRRFEDRNHGQEIYCTLVKLKNLHTLVFKDTYLRAVADVNLNNVKTLTLNDCDFDSSVYPYLKKLRLEGYFRKGHFLSFDPKGIEHAQNLEEICITNPSENAVRRQLANLPKMPNLKIICFECGKEDHYNQIHEWVNLYLPDSADITDGVKIVISMSTTAQELYS